MLPDRVNLFGNYPQIIGEVQDFGGKIFLFYMFIQSACHFKHGNLILYKNWFQRRISIDHTFVHLILKIIFLDINPDFLNDLCPWK